MSWLLVFIRTKLSLERSRLAWHPLSGCVACYDAFGALPGLVRASRWKGRQNLSLGRNSLGCLSFVIFSLSPSMGCDAGFIPAHLRQGSSGPSSSLRFPSDAFLIFSLPFELFRASLLAPFHAPRKDLSVCKGLSSPGRDSAGADRGAESDEEGHRRPRHGQERSLLHHSPRGAKVPNQNHQQHGESQVELRVWGRLLVFFLGLISKCGFGARQHLRTRGKVSFYAHFFVAKNWIGVVVAVCRRDLSLVWEFSSLKDFNLTELNLI